MIVAQTKAATKLIRIIPTFFLFLLIIPGSLRTTNRLGAALVPHARTSLPSKQLDGLSLAQQQDEDVVRVNADLVVLNATVLDKDGKFVSGLKRTDFRVFEDGAEQRVATFSTEETPFAAAILLDSSGSMESRLSLARSAAIRFLDGLREEDVAAVYKFDSKVESVQDFSSGRDLAPVVFGVRAKGMTTLNDAIVEAAKVLADRPEKRKAIIVLSDGMDTYSKASSGKALETALAVGASIYTVDMSATDGSASRNQQSAMILKDFAEKSGGRFVATPGGPALRD